MWRWLPVWKISRIFRRGKVALRPVFLEFVDVGHDGSCALVQPKAPRRASRYNGRSYRYPLFPQCLPFSNAVPGCCGCCRCRHALGLGACSGFSERSRGALPAVTPYKVEVVQGNFVSKEQVAALKTGMSRQQVREILGTSLLDRRLPSANRWDYVFTIRRQGVEPQERRFTVFFNGELLERFEGDEMPSEEGIRRHARHPQENRQGARRSKATEEELKKFAPRATGQATDDTRARRPPAAPQLPAAYPPLEAALEAAHGWRAELDIERGGRGFARFIGPYRRPTASKTESA